MYKKELTEIIYIQDRSGSMHSILSDDVCGFNKFLKEQKECESEDNKTFVICNATAIKKIHRSIHLDEMKECTERSEELALVLLTDVDVVKVCCGGQYISMSSRISKND